MGAVTALGVGAEILHRRWSAGELGIDGGFGAATGFEPSERLSTKQLRRSDRFTQLALVAADEAIAQAGWDGGTGGHDPSRVACVIGTGIGGLETIETDIELLRDGGTRALPALAIPMLMPNAAGAAVALRHGAHGPTFATVSACASGANAIGTGLRLIQSGEVDAAIVGGTEAALTAFARAAFAKMGALSPTGVSRPFDRDRDGFVMGEGAGVLVLEAEELARERGAPLLGRVLGYGTTLDAHHLTAPDPEGRFAARAIEAALAEAGVAPAAVDYVNAHGTSTPLNDLAEARALRLALGDAAGRVPVSSTKSTLGHLLGAGGAVEAIATLLALGAALAPPNLGFEHADPEVPLDVVTGTARTLERRDGQPLVGLSNSFGFGGHNAVLCLAA